MPAPRHQLGSQFFELHLSLIARSALGLKLSLKLFCLHITPDVRKSLSWNFAPEEKNERNDVGQITDFGREIRDGDGILGGSDVVCLDTALRKFQLAPDNDTSTHVTEDEGQDSRHPWEDVTESEDENGQVTQQLQLQMTNAHQLVERTVEYQAEMIVCHEVAESDIEQGSVGGRGGGLETDGNGSCQEEGHQD
ncbi:hypothetical protein EJ07DRAFT_184076 [Lizonia empirigonia]|nr:hypothetical protein EJ07DRAFT_184076 [Lizonia empirigonia]